MRGEVARLSALDEAAARLARSGPEPTRGFFTLFGAGLERLGELEVSELWDAAARTLPLTPDEREALSAAGRCLGRYGAEEQLAALGRSIEELSACALRARERAESGGRLYTGAGLAAGLLAAIVLY